MTSLNDQSEPDVRVGQDGHPTGTGRRRLSRDFFAGRYRPGQSVKLSEIRRQYGLDRKSVLRTFVDFQSLGMVTLLGDSSAIVRSPDPREMREAYEIRAALEEIAGRRAATALKGNTAGLQHELNAMRDAAEAGSLDVYAEHDAKFHKSILRASQNEVLLRVWDTLALELRIRAALGKISKDLREVVESHQPIVDALEKGHGREAALLLRNHVETFLEYLKMKVEEGCGFLRRTSQGYRWGFWRPARRGVASGFRYGRHGSIMAFEVRSPFSSSWKPSCSCTYCGAVGCCLAGR